MERIKMVIKFRETTVVIETYIKKIYNMATFFFFFVFFFLQPTDSGKSSL